MPTGFFPANGIRLEEYRENGGVVIRAELPEGTSEADVTAAYRDGVLEIRLPVPKVETEPPRKIRSRPASCCHEAMRRAPGEGARTAPVQG